MTAGDPVCADMSGWQVNGVPVVTATAALLCPDCLGDWCPSCDWTGLNLPPSPAATVHELLAGRMPAPSVERCAA